MTGVHFWYDGAVTLSSWGLRRDFWVSVQRALAGLVSGEPLATRKQAPNPSRYCALCLSSQMDIQMFTQPCFGSPFDLVSGFLLDWAAFSRWVKVSQLSEPYSLVQASHVDVPRRSFLTLGVGPRQALNLVNLDIWKKKLFKNIQECAIEVENCDTLTLLFFNSDIRISNI